MNERIRKLYIQAINDTKHDPADDINIQIAEKFAELIVTECLNLVDRGGEFVSRPKLVERIKEHFGVEE